MTRPKHEGADMDNHYHLTSTSKPIRRIPSYRPLPVPGAEAGTATPAVLPKPQGPRANTSTLSFSSTMTGIQRKPSGLSLSLSIPTKPSSLTTAAATTTSNTMNGAHPQSPTSPTRFSPTHSSAFAQAQRSIPLLSTHPRRRCKPRSAQVPSGIDSSSSSSSESDGEGEKRYGRVVPSTITTASGPSLPLRRGFSIAAAATPTTASSYSSTHTRNSPTTPTFTSTSSPHLSRPGPFASSPPRSTPTTITIPAPPPSQIITLKSPPSQSTLRLKRSKRSLLSLTSPPPSALSKPMHNMNPYIVFINRLPPELLGSVFLLLISPGCPDLKGIGSSIDTKAPRVVSQVCHFWRCVALGEPLLWARTLNLREGPKWVVEVLKRSGECAIDVIGLRDASSGFSSTRLGNGYNSYSGGIDYHESGRGKVSILGVVLGELKRIRSLHLTIERKEEWRWIMDVLMKEEAPTLESLAVKNCVQRVVNVPPGSNGHLYGSFGAEIGMAMGLDMDGGDDLTMRLTEGWFKGKAPKLKTLSLSMISLSLDSSLPYLSSLTTLQITDPEGAYRMNTSSWLSIVRQTPLLHTLILRSTFSAEDSLPPSSPAQQQNVVLKKLKFIELKGVLMECCEFLERLVVPGECRLALGCSRANNVTAVEVLGEWLKERKMRSEQMEGILRTPWEVMRESERERRRGRCLLVHPSAARLIIKVNEVAEVGGAGGEEKCPEEDEGECVVNLDLVFGYVDQSEERHRNVIEILDILRRALQVVYEDKGGFDALNLSLFGVRDGMSFWKEMLVQFLASLDRVEHLQEMSGYTASVVFPLLVQSPQQHQHQRRGSSASVASVASTSPAERYRQNVLLPSLSRVTFAFVEFAKNVDDEFEASCDVRAVPDFVKRRYGLGKEVGGISVVRQRVGSLKMRFECCSGPKSILEELKRLGVEYGLGWACDFDE